MTAAMRPKSHDQTGNTRSGGNEFSRLSRWLDDGPCPLENARNSASTGRLWTDRDAPRVDGRTFSCGRLASSTDGSRKFPWHDGPPSPEVDHHGHQTSSFARHKSAVAVAGPATSGLSDSDVELRQCDDDVTGNDATNPDSDDNKVRPSTDGLSPLLFSRQQPTGSINSGNGGKRSKLGVATADFSQQTVQDGATQTPVAVHLCSFDGDDVSHNPPTTVRLVGGLDDAVTSPDHVVSDQPWWTRLLDTAGLNYVIALRDRATQTNEITGGDFTDPRTATRRDFYTQTFGLPATPVEPEVTSCIESPASTSFQIDTDDNDDDEEEEEATGSEILLCSRCGARLTLDGASPGRCLIARELTPQPSSDVIDSLDRRRKEPPSHKSSSSSLRRPTTTRKDDDAAVETVQSTNQVDSGEVLSALGALLSAQLTCDRCANQPRSSRPPSNDSEDPNQRVPLATDGNTTSAPLANNGEVTSDTSAGELMRHILHDIKKLNRTIARQGAAPRGGHRSKRHQADVDELQHHKEPVPQRRSTRPWTSLINLSNDDDEYATRKQRHLRYSSSPPRSPLETRGARLNGDLPANREQRDFEADRAQRLRRLERLYESLEPARARRSYRRNQSMDNDEDVDDQSAPPSPPPPRRSYPNRRPDRLPGELRGGFPGEIHPAGGVPQPHTYDPIGLQRTMPPSHPPFQQFPQQYPQPQPAQQYSPHPQQFYQQLMQPYPHQSVQQAQPYLPSAFRPIHQTAPLQRQPLVFVPMHQQQYNRPEHFDSSGVATRTVNPRVLPARVQVHAQKLSDAMKLAKETKHLTAQIQSRGRHAYT